MKSQSFMGYPRKGGRVGARNHVAIIPTVFCVNEIVESLGHLVPGTKPLTHQHGCCELKPDLDRTARVLCGLIENPNVGACLIVSLGCEGVSGEDLLKAAQQAGKPAARIVLHEEGGMTNCVARGQEALEDLKAETIKMERAEFDVSQIVLGIKCGSSDATSGLAANPAVGATVDAFIESNGTAVFGEITELIGAEHIVAKRCRTREIEQRLLAVVDRTENRIRRIGVDLRGSQPTPGNIEGGLTTIEEKSLGAICKSGTKPIDDVLEYAQSIGGRGLFVMDSPGKEDEIMTGLAAAGVNLILFATGGGAPQGFPLVPVIKVGSNPQKCVKMREHIDVDASSILVGKESIDELGKRIFDQVMVVASGEMTKAEQLGYDRTIGIYAHGLTV